MLVVLVAGGCLGWTCYEARVQREAVAAIERAHGQVEFDWEFDLDSNPHGKPGWLRQHLGPGFFEQVTRVSFSGTADDALMADVGQFRHLQILWIEGGAVTDAGLAPIENLRTLRDVTLGSTRVTDNGIARLRRLTRLESLVVSGTGITDAGLAIIVGLPNVQVLMLQSTRITDAGLARLTNSKSCRIVYVAGTNVTPEGIAAMKAKCPWIIIWP
jgi:hypothetical protein